MVINISVQYNGGLLPDIMLLTQDYYHYWRTRLNTMQWLCIYSLCSSILITTAMCDGVLYCFWIVFNVFLVSLHGD